MLSNWVSLTKINDRAAESVKQDQTARMCRMILLYTIRKNKWMVENARIRFKINMKDNMQSPVRVLKSLNRISEHEVAGSKSEFFKFPSENF